MMQDVEVDFVKASRHYIIRVRRDVGPILAPGYGPGFDEWMPHDVAHMLVEIEAGLSGAVFGRIASGQNNLFRPVDPRQQRKAARRRSHPTPQQRADMSISERLASACVPAWEQDRGRRATLPDWLTRDRLDDIDTDLRRRIFDRFDTFAERWHRLVAGEVVTVHWPSGTYLDC
ncbi:hypothetical protein [Williamsia sterculiae]|uniref:Uncharacterized protein n=1 Tax=Williamsia sterculiae TaxID=1344003 RepID=A0A1N7ERD1_9NOCA|nr:hypothetical protein [Williamsia sterculiae]SIR90627.1 hypothetical protein SAMN05445060_1600 [Williamsia sterculiae]